MPVPDRLPSPYRPEADVVIACLEALDGGLDWPAAASQAKPWVQAVRDHPPPFWAMESLLREYPISSAEGLALMRLAEALLRVPDMATAMALTADQLGRADFSEAGEGVMAQLSGAALALSKTLLPSGAGSPGLLARMGGASVVAAALRAVQLLGRQFVLGQAMGEAMKEADAARKKQHGLRFSYDMLGEGARTDADALRYLKSYQDAIDFIADSVDSKRACELNDGISIKLSALHARYEDAQHARVMRELVPRVWGLCERAAAANINLTIDAEEVDRLELSLKVFEALTEKVAATCPQWRGFGLALQAYQTRALELIDHVAAIARKYRLRLMCRLVKGAYWDAEIKRAQELGLPHYPVFTHKHHTDVSYLACARALLAASDVVYPQFATHNAGTIAAIVQMAAHAPDTPRFELQRLHGMGEGIYRELLKNPSMACRVYAPVGAHRDLLAYLVRRLLENGANSSFVHQLADESVGMPALLVSPLWHETTDAMPLPPALYGAARVNSHGLDLAVASMREPLLAAYAVTHLPVVPAFDAKLAAKPYGKSAISYGKWSNRPVAERAAILRQAADALQAQLPTFCALMVREAHKSWGDAVAEVREAVDFLRYYANEAERIMAPISLPGPTGESNELRLTARGVWVCISPWNFPLAIFMGQMAAALVTGNTVLAKPAEQTPGVALAAVRMLHAAGVPEDALQLLHGPGETVGAALVALPGIAGVVFTGSTQVAKTIQRALAAKDGPIQPLIAETGGINAMLVDSSALPEQVVDAVVQSAFRSAGQRCSALRLLCVHEAIADVVIDMLRGAAQELVVGDPAQLATDVGPVIDREAFETVRAHLERLDKEEKRLFPLDGYVDSAINSVANMVVPHLYEVRSIAGVKQEIFGPVLQVVRWGKGELSDPLAVIVQINALGFGLTLGIQTRIDSRAQSLARAAHIGNVYINRNMIGAVVGVQPFGGEGLSGTGPKAGGPHYLYRFCAEQTLTVNTAAAGGNATLLASMQ
ncbi:MAG: L-glutamate gamma-semialdehyde dehydrogenase [Gammaproteobacteria bacterium]|nr:L-glutamate gamma-semialdehyde dehydrogenase [Gammaproteobacteria bacterium]MBU0788054.1 L-glutamate gamma-semialdehyde dehydrogenase [Gammaproteobacteria bacterium]MBU0815448.1 L-glutamate gamma-semialdehyde dehydrogenase [Gammaproteobacteria bacterium]MBU1785444.1 L-glutamate gamma-semialdehyde dehydrogenase [Gammaproteobacteria bacterium]